MCLCAVEEAEKVWRQTRVDCCLWPLALAAGAPTRTTSRQSGSGDWNRAYSHSERVHAVRFTRAMRDLQLFQHLSVAAWRGSIHLHGSHSRCQLADARRAHRH